MRELMVIRAFQDSDWSEWLRLSQALFPNATADDLAAGMHHFRQRGRRDAEVFVVDRGDGRLAGFLEVGMRPYADGCDTSPVAYLEAWYVDPDVRRHGHGQALVASAERWARAQGYREMASDTQLENIVSQAAHRRAGYQEFDRIMQFRKDLSAER